RELKIDKSSLKSWNICRWVLQVVGRERQFRYSFEPFVRWKPLPVTVLFRFHRFDAVKLADTLVHVSLLTQTASRSSGGRKITIPELIAERADFFLLLDRLRCRCNRTQGHRVRLGLLAQDVFAVHLHHLLVFGLLFELGVASPKLFFTRGLGDSG